MTIRIDCETYRLKRLSARLYRWRCGDRWGLIMARHDLEAHMTMLDMMKPA